MIFLVLCGEQSSDIFMNPVSLKPTRMEPPSLFYFVCLKEQCHATYPLLSNSAKNWSFPFIWGPHFHELWKLQQLELGGWELKYQIMFNLNSKIVQLQRWYCFDWHWKSWCFCSLGSFGLLSLLTNGRLFSCVFENLFLWMNKSVSLFHSNSFTTSHTIPCFLLFSPTGVRIRLFNLTIKLISCILYVIRACRDTDPENAGWWEIHFVNSYTYLSPQNCCSLVPKLHSYYPLLLPTRLKLNPLQRSNRV